jgi:crotonobetainyl-CoA:carnitine CoA-transferase CaiB-like acyl-CoA transferase
MATPQAMAGIRVLDFSWFAAAPIGTKWLADHGAEVIRVESHERLDCAPRVGQWAFSRLHARPQWQRLF